MLLSRTKAGPGRTVQQEQEEISQNHVQRLNLISVYVRYRAQFFDHPDRARIPHFCAVTQAAVKKSVEEKK